MYIYITNLTQNQELVHIFKLNIIIIYLLKLFNFRDFLIEAKIFIKKFNILSLINIYF
jgi:hypothetical protein